MKGQGRQPRPQKGALQCSDHPAEGWSKLREQGGLGSGAPQLKVTQRAAYTEVYFSQNWRPRVQDEGARVGRLVRVLPLVHRGTC